MSTPCSDIALAAAAGPMKDMLDKLSGENGATWLEAWKTLTVGGNTKDELLAQFAEAKLPSGVIGIQASDCARDIAGKPACDFLKEKEEGVEFVMGSLRDLFGFEENIKTEVFLNEAFLAKHGLELCKPSDAFYLRLAYLDQLLDEWIRIGMNPITDSDGYPSVFDLGHFSDGMWLSAIYADPDYQWDPDNRWFFRRKKVTQS